MKKQMRKMAIPVLAFIGLLQANAGVIMTGILHGTLAGGAPKAIELFITGTEDLGNYEIRRSLNGAPFGSGSGSVATLSGTYSNTFVFLVKPDHLDEFQSVFGSEGIYANVILMGIVTGNGNDAFQIRNKITYQVIDQVWYENATDSYRNSYWYRRHGTGPDGGWNPSAWETPGNDALLGLDAAGLRAAVPFGTYAVVWKGLSPDWQAISNWSSGQVPSYQTNILIPDTADSFPVVSNPPANCMNLIMVDTARLVIESESTLDVSGNLEMIQP